jgi:hypothetical protein
MGIKQQQRYFFGVALLKKRGYNAYFSTICLPNGVRAKPASLKC